ncbi:MAG: hypothetical protein QOF45_790 [Gaiellaceae bacterium]|nr:hypothetical protein [Gaiellaceae bacterium]
MAEPLPDVVSEARRVLALAEGRSVALRLLGGVAVRLRAAEAFPETLSRSYGDLDFVTAKGSSGAVGELFSAAGYEADRAFNALHGRERLIFYDEPNGRKVDVFVGQFAMCHEVPVGERLGVDPISIPLAELLLTKLQVVELNEKDVTDVIALLATHELGDEDGSRLNAARVAALCAADWGLWRTITANLAVCRERVSEAPVQEAVRQQVGERLDALLERIEAEPKTRGWKLRARVGERKRWYDLPEEVEAGV